MVIGNIILDLVLVLLIAFGFYFGWKRGFLRIVLKTFAGLFSAVIAASFFGSLAAVLKEKYVYTFVHGKLTEALGDLTSGASAESIAEAIPSGLRDTAALVGIDLGAMAETATKEGQNAILTFVEDASHSVSQMIASAAAFILIFLGAFLVLRVLSTPINAIVMRIPVLGHINRFLGLLFGAATALILSWLFVLLVGFLDGALSLSFLEVNDSWIGGLFYRFSLFS